MRKMCLTGRATLRLWKQFDVCTCTSVKCFIPKRKMCLTGMATLRLWKQFDVCTCTSVKCFIPKRKFIVNILSNTVYICQPGSLVQFSSCTCMQTDNKAYYDVCTYTVHVFIANIRESSLIAI